MPQPKPRPPAAPFDAPTPGAATIAVLFNALAPVLAEDGGAFAFTGAIEKRHARAIWTWLARDVAPELLGTAGPDFDIETLRAMAPELVERAGRVIESVRHGSDAELRLKSQLGGAMVWDCLPAALTALKSLPLLDRAAAFGRAVNAIEDDAGLVAALESIPRRDGRLAALLMMAAMGQVIAPGRLLQAAVGLAGGEDEAALDRAGFGPLLDAILAQAQNLVPAVRQTGPFADIDLTCRAVERFHRFVYPVLTYVELEHPGPRRERVGTLIRFVSNELEPRLRQLTPDISRALRQGRDGVDRLDADSLLAALNGVYLLGVVRDCRGSLALNEAFDETWVRAGDTLEFHLTRTMDRLRASPADTVLAERLASGIKMAEIRFGPDYAEALRAGRDVLVRRLAEGIRFG
jgi:hypothetical protein